MDSKKSCSKIKPLKIIQNLALLLGSTCVALLVCEVIVRQFVPMGTMRYSVNDGLRWNTKNSEFKYVLTPGYSGRLSFKEYDVKVNINSLGFRDEEKDVTALNDKKRIFVIGDSFVFGIGVESQNSLPKHMEAIINQEATNQYDVWNLGTPSYGIQQYMGTFKKYLKYQPSIVVLCITATRIRGGVVVDSISADDIYGSADYERLHNKRESLRYDEQNHSNIPRRPLIKKYGHMFYALKKWMSRNSALYNYIIISYGQKIRAMTHKLSDVSEVNKETWEMGLKILKKNLFELKEVSESKNINLYVVYLPSKADVDNKYLGISVRLKELTDELKIDFVDLMSEFQSLPTDGYYFPIDGHFTSKGNEAAAQNIVDRISHNLAIV